MAYPYTYLEIEVPDENDSMSRIALERKLYYIRFTWNETAHCWTMGLYDSGQTPIVLGLKMVPRFPLNVYVSHLRLPFGIFFVESDKDYVGRKDFVDGTAHFIYISINDNVDVNS